MRVNQFSNYLLSGLLLLFLIVPTSAKSWHGIIPLHSTRSDVRRLLGNPVFGGDGSIELYENEAGHVHVMYARGPCEQGLPADWGNWRVAKDTVVNISITLNKDLPLSELRIPRLRTLKWYTDDAGATYYHDKQKGIEYQVEGRMVTAITYGPAASDTNLRCKKDVPRLRY
jgi:hypothetical protein